MCSTYVSVRNTGPPTDKQPRRLRNAVIAANDGYRFAHARQQVVVLLQVNVAVGYIDWSSDTGVARCCPGVLQRAETDSEILEVIALRNAATRCRASLKCITAN